MLTNEERIEKENFFYICNMFGMEVYAKFIKWQGEDYVQMVQYAPEADYVVSWNDIKPLYTYELMSKIFNTLKCAEESGVI